MIVPIQEHPSFKKLAEEVRQLSPSRRANLDATIGGSFDEERTLTVEDIADVLDVHVVTVRRWIRNGELKATRIRGYRVNPVDLSAFLQKRGIPMKRDGDKQP
jgi:excisionase family DNA binding protein